MSIGLMAVGGLLLASCAGTSPPPGAGGAGTSTDSPAEFIIGTWDCTPYVANVEQNVDITYVISRETLEVRQHDFTFKAEYNIVGDTMSITSTEISEGGGDAGGTVDVENFPVVMPEAGEKVNLSGVSDGQPTTSLTAYTDGAGTVFLEDTVRDSTLECVRR